MDSMDSDVTKYGSIYWPLYPYKVIRSDLVHVVLKDGEEIVCPNLIEVDKCVLQLKKAGSTFCKFSIVGATKSRNKCPYSEYHEFFLLSDPPTSHTVITPAAKYDLSLGFSDDNINMGLEGKRDALAVSLNYFPQHNKIKMSSKRIRENASMQIAFFGEWQARIEVAGKYDGSKPQKGAQDFYAASEYVLWKGEKDTSAEMAFLDLVNIQSLNELLPKSDFDSKRDSYMVVAISFFADGRIDGLSSLMINNKDPLSTPRNSELTDAEKFVSQALINLNQTIMRQRDMFLYQWCQRLRSRVSQKFNSGLKNILRPSKPNYTDKVNNAKDAAVNFGIKALKRMIITLLADEKLQYNKVDKNNKIFKEGLPSLKLNDASECRDFNCLVDGTIYKTCRDRCKFICEFCKQAKTSIEEAFSNAKLKGLLSRKTSDELITIAKDDLISARVLLQGGAGGGKGVAAKDFHAHCMERIVKPLSKIKIGSDEKVLAETNFVLDNNNRNLSLTYLKDWWNAVKNKKTDYLVQIENVLRRLRDLPSYVESAKGNVVVYDYFRKQIIGTGWWTWGGRSDSGTPYDKLKDLIEHFRNMDGYPEIKDTDKQVDKQWDWCIQTFLLLLGMKLVVELQQEEKADWTFNLFQINCGIMGGENSELAESIQRLFGRGEKEHETPGIFQTCSYVGGTLFLDEIADAPVRIQDNLLRPLEEGQVSRPGWETIDEEVGNLRIVGATFKDLFKLSAQYQETLPSGKPRGFRPDLLTRLTRNPPVTVVPIWHHFVPDGRYNEKTLRNQFCYVMAAATVKKELKPSFWNGVYQLVTEKINDHCRIAAKHLPDELDRRRHFASKITMRLFMALKDRNFEDEKKEREELKGGHKEYLDRMLDYLMCDS